MFVNHCRSGAARSLPHCLSFPEHNPRAEPPARDTGLKPLVPGAGLSLGGGAGAPSRDRGCSDGQVPAEGGSGPGAQVGLTVVGGPG